MKKKTKDSSLSEKRNLREFERRRSNREAILQAAEAVICRKGLAAASMDDVAAEAGFSKATVYKYVPSKTELVYELLIHFIEDLDACVEKIVARPLKYETRFRTLIREIILRQRAKENIARAFLVDPSLIRLFHVMAGEEKKGGGVASGPEYEFLRRVLVVRRGVMSRVEAFLEEGIQIGTFRSMSPAAGTRFLSAVLQGYQHDNFFEEPKPDLEKDVSDIYTFVLRGMSSGNHTRNSEDRGE
ncbi:MAG: TetR/AcrR family transcriptional regulator [Candidatus Aminicenantes bacterium]|nr:TetR/AcrR family transcriptional regulator [Candidatus Aminicenantes bacterium]